MNTSPPHSDSTPPPRERLMVVGLDELRRAPGSPAPATPPGELVESVRTYGVLHPLLARPGGEGYEVVAGFKRLEAAREAGLAEVPLRVFRVADEALEGMREAANVTGTQKRSPHPAPRKEFKSTGSLSGLLEEEFNRKPSETPYAAILAITAVAALLLWGGFTLVQRWTSGTDEPPIDDPIDSPPDLVKNGGDESQPPPRGDDGRVVRWRRVLADIDGVEVRNVSNHPRVVFADAIFSRLTTIAPEQKARLRRVAEAIHRAEPATMLVLIGHTDDDPVRANSTYRDNEHLGTLRARAVAEYLAEDSPFPVHQLRDQSAGDTNPPYSNDNPEDKVRNRTVSIEIIPPNQP